VGVFRLKRELATAIARAASQGEDYLIELTNQICTCLQVRLTSTLIIITIANNNNYH